MAVTTPDGYVVDQGLTADNEPILKISMPIDDTGEYFSPVGYMEIGDIKNLPYNIQSNRTIFKENIKGKTFIFGYAQARKEEFKCELKSLNNILANEITHIIKDIYSSYIPWAHHKTQVFFKKTDGILHNIGHETRTPKQLTYDIHTTYTRILFGILKYNEEGLQLTNTCLDPHDTCIPARVKQIVKIPFTNKFYRIDYTEVLLYAKKVHAAFEIIPNEDAEEEIAEAEINLITDFDYEDNTPIVTLEPAGTHYIDSSVRYPGDLDSGCLVTSGSYSIDYLNSINIVDLGNIAFLTDLGVIKVDIIDYYDGIYDDYYYNSYLDECLTAFEIVSGFYFQTSRFKLTNLPLFTWNNFRPNIQFQNQPPSTNSFYTVSSEIDYRNDEFMQEIYAYAPIEIYKGLKGEYIEYAGAIAELSIAHEGGVKKAKRNDLLIQGSAPDYEDLYERYERDDTEIFTPKILQPKKAFDRQILWKNTRAPIIGKTTTDMWWKIQQVIIGKLQPLIHKRFRNVHAIGLEHWMYPLQIIEDLIAYKEELGLTTTCLADANDAYNEVIDNGGTEEEALQAREDTLNACFFGEYAASHRTDGPIIELLYNRQDTHQPTIEKSFNYITRPSTFFAKTYNFHVNTIAELYNKLYAAGKIWIESTGKDIDCDDLMRYGELALEAIDAEVKSIGTNFKRFLAEILVRVKFNLGVPAFPKFIKFTYDVPTNATNLIYNQPPNSELSYNMMGDAEIKYDGNEYKNDMNSVVYINEIPEDTELYLAFKIPEFKTDINGLDNLCIRLGKDNDLTGIQIFKTDGTHVFGTELQPEKAQLFFSLHTDVFDQPNTYPNTGIESIDSVPYLPYKNELGSLDVTTYENDGIGQIFINKHDIFYEDVINYPTKYGFYDNLALEKYHQFIIVNEYITEEYVICVSGRNSIDLSIEYLRLEALWLDNDTEEVIGQAPIELLNEFEIAYKDVWHKEGWTLVPQISRYAAPYSIPINLEGTKYQKYVDELYEKCFQDDVTILDPTLYINDRFESTTWTPVNEQKHLYTDVIPGKVHQIHVLNYCNRIECEKPKVGPIFGSDCAIKFEDHKEGFLEDELKTSGSRCFYNDTLSRKSGEMIWTGAWYDTLSTGSTTTDCYDFCLNQANILYQDAIDNGLHEIEAAKIRADFLAVCINNQNAAAPDCYYKCVISADIEEKLNILDGMDPYLASLYKILTIANCFPACTIDGCLSECMKTAVSAQIDALKNGSTDAEAELIYWQHLWNCSDVCTGDCAAACKAEAVIQYEALIDQGYSSDDALLEIAPSLKSCYLMCDPTNVPPECGSGSDGDDGNSDNGDNGDNSDSTISDDITTCLIELYNTAKALYDKYGDPDSPDYDENWDPDPIDTSVCYSAYTYCVTNCTSTYTSNLNTAIDNGYTLEEAIAMYSYEKSVCMSHCISGECSSNCSTLYDSVVLEYYNDGYTLEEAYAEAYAQQAVCLHSCLNAGCVAECAQTNKDEYIDNLNNGMEPDEALELFKTNVTDCITNICDIDSNMTQCVVDCLVGNLLEYMTLLDALDGETTVELESWYDTANNECYYNCESELDHHTVYLKLYHFTQVLGQEPRLSDIARFNTIGYEVPDIDGIIVRILPEIIEKPKHPYYILPKPIWYEILKITLIGGYPREIHAKSIPSRAVMHYKFFMPEKVQFEENRTRFFTRSSKYQRTMLIKAGSTMLNRSDEGVLHPYLEYLDTEGWVVCIDNQTDFEKVYDIIFLSNLKVIGFYDYDDIFNRHYNRIEYNILNFMNVSKICYITAKPDMDQYTVNQVKNMYIELMNRLELFFGSNIKIGIMFDYDFPTEAIEEIYSIDIVDKIIFDANTDEDVVNVWDNHGLASYGNDIVFLVTLTKVKDYKIQEMFDRWRVAYNYNEIIINDANSFAISQEYTNYKNSLNTGS